MKVYTKTGDKGETSLVSGTRVFKDDTRIGLYGAVDELNSLIGVSLSFVSSKDFENIHALMERVQCELFSLGSQLACEAEHREKYRLPEIKEEMIKDIESSIDMMSGELPALKNFILPSGDQAATFFHLSRTKCREVERMLVGFKRENPQEVSDAATSLLNRLSDYFFVVARYINFKKNKIETVWNP